jgi:hypothetical protein
VSTQCWKNICWVMVCQPASHGNCKLSYLKCLQ